MRVRVQKCVCVFFSIKKSHTDAVDMGQGICYFSPFFSMRTPIESG